MRALMLLEVHDLDDPHPGDLVADNEPLLVQFVEQLAYVTLVVG
jgi:hypothetical protein